MPRETPPERGQFVHWDTIVTRWADNDLYGHVNNVHYYAFFDTVINNYLLAQGVLDLHNGSVRGYAVESGCAFLRPVAYPDVLEVGLRVAKLGRSSVRYELAIFKRGDEACAAHGHFVHVFVARETQRPVELPEPLRAALSKLVLA